MALSFTDEESINSIDFALIKSTRKVFNGVGKDDDHGQDETNNIEKNRKCK